MVQEILIPFVAVGLAELGDKTQLAVLCLASKTRKYVQLLAGVMLAFVIADGLAILLGSFVTERVPMVYIKVVSGIVFIVFGILTLLRTKADDPQCDLRQPFASGFGLVLVSELGDKTQIAAGLFAAKYDAVMVFIGVMAALALLSVLAVYLGRFIALKVNRRIISRVAGAVFIVLGIVAFLPGCSRNEESPKLVLRKVAEKYKAMDSCVMDYSIRTEGGGEVAEIRGTVYAKEGNLRYEETVMTTADTLKQIRVSNGQAIYQILPEHGVVKGVNLEPGTRESNLRAVGQKGALVSVLPIPDEQWNPRGGVRTRGQGADRRLVVVASPPGSPGSAKSTYTFFIEPGTYLMREIEADLTQQLAAGVIKSRTRNSYSNYRVQAEVLDTMFRVNMGEK